MGKGVKCNKLNRISGHVVLDENKSNYLISRLLHSRKHVSERSPASFSLFLFCSGVHVDVILSRFRVLTCFETTADQAAPSHR